MMSTNRRRTVDAYADDLRIHRLAQMGATTTEIAAALGKPWTTVADRRTYMQTMMPLLIKQQAAKRAGLT